MAWLGFACVYSAWLDLSPLGLACLRLDSLAWLGMSSLVFAWLGFDWLRLDGLCFAWIRLAWLRLASLGFAWLRLASLGCRDNRIFRLPKCGSLVHAENLHTRSWGAVETCVPLLDKSAF